MKEMLAARGKPKDHQLPREIFEDWWLEFLED
jgi:hypothetical protein